MQILFIFFILISLVVVLGSFYLKFNSNQPISAFMLSVGFLIMAIVFGLQWFTLSGEFTASSGLGSWPPAINVCPDFLSLSSDGEENQFCIDTLGVSNPPSGSPTGGLQKWTANGGSATRFELHVEKPSKTRVERLCEQCKNYGLTWEGLTDGITCSGKEPPIPY